MTYLLKTLKNHFFKYTYKCLFISYFSKFFSFLKSANLILIMDHDIYNQLYKRKLLPEEIYEVNQNLIGFFKLLIEIDLEKKKNDRYDSTDNSKK